MTYRSRIHRLAQALAAALALLICRTALAAANPAVVYVSPQGSDQWSGRRSRANASRTDGPLATLDAALRATRMDHTQTPPRIVVSGGTYLVTDPVDILPEDSGLTVEAARGEHPVFVGGRRLTSWSREGDRFWSAPMPEGVGADGLRLLVVKGEMRPRSRLPESGSFSHLTEFDVPWMSTTGGGWKRKPTMEELTTLRYRKGDLGEWLDTASAELTIYHMWDESVVGLKAHDPATQTLTFSTPAGHPPGAFGIRKYVVWNVREGMLRPGQWYFDRSARKVVYWPLPGEKLDRFEALVPAIGTVIRVRGSQDRPVTGVILRGLTVTLTNTPLKAGGFGAGSFDGAIALDHIHRCTLADLTVRNVAGQGIRASSATALTVSRCSVSHTGACGIIANGKGIRLADNDIHDVGRIYPSAIGLWFNGSDSEVSHNEIHDCPYSGIIGSGNDQLVVGNLIYRVMQELHDGGGIYVSACKRVTLRGNVIRDIVDTGGYGASAYYLDEQAEDCVVEGNISLNVARPSHNHMARHNMLRGNIFVMPGDGKLTFPRCSGYTLEQNVICAGGTLTFETPPDGIRAMGRNLLYSGSNQLTLGTLSDYLVQGTAKLETRDGSVFGDPLFTNIRKNELRFKRGSPAETLGIRPLLINQAGRRK